MSAHYRVDRPTNVERFNASHINMHANSLNLQVESSRNRQLDAGRQASRSIWPRMKTHQELSDIFTHDVSAANIVTNINQLT